MAEFDLGIKQLEQALRNGLKAVDSGRVYTRALNYLGNTAGKHLRDLTPVRTNTMRSNWRMDVDKSSKSVRLYNPIEYATYVDLGHRIVRKGKTIGFVKGKHMLRKSIKITEQQSMPRALDMVFTDLSKEMRP